MAETTQTNLLLEVKAYLDITWNDEATDTKLSGIIERGKVFLQSIAGDGSINFNAQAQEKQLLFDWCMYARNGIADQFKINYQSDLIALRLKYQTDKVVLTDEQQDTNSDV